MNSDVRNNTNVLLMAAILIPVIAFAGTSGPSPIPPAPGFNVTAAPLVVCRGLTNYVQVTISDNSSYLNESMRDVAIGFSNNYVQVIGKTPEIKTVDANSKATVTVPLFVSDDAPSLLQIKIPITYSYLMLYQDSEVENMTFYAVQCPAASPLNISTSATNVVSGQINNITISFANKGSVPLYNVSAEISISSQGSYLINKNSNMEIGDILPGSSVNVTEQMFANSSQVILPFSVNATFFNGTSFDQALDTFSLMSGGSIDMVPTGISSSPSIVSPGGIFSVSFILTNTGTGSVTDAGATANIPKGFAQYGSSGSEFLGSIGTESPTPVSLTIVSNSSVKAGTYVIPVNVSYLNNFRQQRSTIVKVPIIVATGAGSVNTNGTGSLVASSSGSGGLIVGIVTFAAIIVGIFFIAKWNRAKSMKDR